MKKIGGYRRELEKYDKVETKISDIETLFELAEEDSSATAEIEGEVRELEKMVSNIRLQTLLSGKYDRASAILSIHPGAGGTESCDWAEMLQRMYTRYSQTKGWETSVLDQQPGDEAGIKSVTLQVEGLFAYGFLKGESGVHRLVRVSPFDSNSRRHTSFASVDVSPVVDDEVEIEVREEDLRIDTFRSSGAGGQHVNVTDSAVRIVHNPTGIVVSCQNERSQHQNKAVALKVLKSKLLELELRRREEELSRVKGEKNRIEWGSQIRSYVFFPYEMVKDLRSDYSTSNVRGVMDGEIDELIESVLRSRIETFGRDDEG